jgi:hypothetical protein
MTERTTPLTKKDKEEWFKQHLPYRKTMLNTYKLITKDEPEYQKEIPKKIVEYINTCSAEASRIACRFFIEFMGLATKKSQLIEKRNYHIDSDGKTYEVKIVDLGGKWVDIKELTSNEKELLIKTNETGHKATAHMTYKDPLCGEHEIIYDSVELINRLLETHLYDIVKNEYK